MCAPRTRLLILPLLLLLSGSPGAEEASLLRVFLLDGTTLTSFGEYARVGDRIKFSMTNRSDEPVPGIRVTAAPMMHSMDFHAAMVSPQDKYRSIAPGQTIEF